MSARDMFGEPLVQDPATTIRILREQLNAANEKLLDALRREKAALDRIDTIIVNHAKEVALFNERIATLHKMLAEECE